MKQKKLKNNGYVSEDTKEVRNLIIITLIIVVIGVGLYFLTEKVLNKKDSTSDVTSKVEFDYNVCSVGTMFNRPYDEYYVFLYDGTSDDASSYNSLLTTYRSKKDSKKIFFVDLGNKFNSSFVGEKSNTNPTKSTEVMVKNNALVLIKNGKVAKYYESKGDYEKVLS